MNSKPKTIVLAAGGTAGHIQPLLTVAGKLRDQGYQLIILGTKEGMEAKLVESGGFKLSLIEKVTLPRRFNTKLFTFPFRLYRSIRQTKAIIQGSDLVVGFGGYVSASAYLAARSLNLPLIVQEQNLTMGFSNRLGKRWAVKVLLAYPNLKARLRQEASPNPALSPSSIEPKVSKSPSFKPPGDKSQPISKEIVTGPILTTWIYDLVKLKQSDAKSFMALKVMQARKYGLDPNLPILLVMGGSLGAKHLCEVVTESLEYLPSNLQVILLTGKNNYRETRQKIDNYFGKSPGQNATLNEQDSTLGLTDKARASEEETPQTSGKKDETVASTLNLTPTVTSNTPKIVVLDYTEKIHELYCLADLALSRSGAGTVSELACLQIPAVFVPLDHGNGEQRLNCLPLVEANGAKLFENSSFSATTFVSEVLPLLESNNTRREMANNLANFATINGAKKVVAEIVETLMSNSSSS